MNILSLVIVIVAVTFFLLKIENWFKRIVGIILVSVVSSGLTFFIEYNFGANILTRNIDSFLALLILAVAIGVIIGVLERYHFIKKDK